MLDEAFFAVETSEPERFVTAIHRFDEENSRDPNKEIVEGVAQPRELLYAQRLCAWVLRLAPAASEPLRLAARCQHIGRWLISRDAYEMTRTGYLRWRSDLKAMHARKAGDILREAGYPAETLLRVQDLNLKSNFPKDSESRVLEDALCLVFLQYQFAELAHRTAEDKIVNALRKSWNKMTPLGQAEALRLSFSPQEMALLNQALRTSP